MPVKKDTLDSEINKARRKIIFESIRLGLKVIDACRRAKVSRDYFYDNIKKHPEFVEEYEQAVLDFKVRNLALIHKASNKAWQPAAWLLERKYPDEFSLRQNFKVTGDVSVNLADVVAKARKARGLE